MEEIVIKNNEEYIPDVLRFIREVLSNKGFSHTFIAFIAVTVDEVLSNIIHYAYTDNETHDIFIRANIKGSVFTLVFEDDGISFNPLLHAAETQADIPLVHRKKGGLGIYLVSQIMDNIDYKRINGKNVLTLTKTAEQAALL